MWLYLDNVKVADAPAFFCQLPHNQFGWWDCCVCLYGAIPPSTKHTSHPESPILAMYRLGYFGEVMCSSRKFQSGHHDLTYMIWRVSHRPVLFNTCIPSHTSITAGKWGDWPPATPSSCREWQTVRPDGENGNQPSANCGTMAATEEGTEEGSNAGGTHQLGPVGNSSYSVVWCGGALVYETWLAISMYH